MGGRALLVYRERSASWAGSERVLAYMVKVLRELGYFTTVLTFDGEWGNGFEKPDVLRGVPGPNGGAYWRLFRFIKGVYSLTYERYVRFRSRFDVVIDVAYNDLRGWVDLGYVHYPYCSARLKLLFPTKARVIAANSTWTLTRLKGCGVSNVVVIHPPVEPIKCRGDPLRLKEDLVIGVGRLSKPWEEFIEVAKLVRARRPGVRFVIMGLTDSMARVRYLKELGQGAVEVLPNVPEGVKADFMCRARAILHTHPAEHFGIAIVEAMSTGAVPVVHRDGGAWLDVVEEGRFGFGFNTVNEAAEQVLNALDANAEYREAVMARSMIFSYGNFKKALITHLNIAATQ